MGFEVDALDVSDVAVAYTARAAAGRGLPVRARVADLAVEPLPAGPYEVVVDSFFLERRVLDGLAGVLAPGGLLLFDTFLADGPADTRFRLLPGELPEILAGLEIVDYREGPPAPGERPRVRLVARRPAPSGPGPRLDLEA